jgi:hypothetical protein
MSPLPQGFKAALFKLLPTATRARVVSPSIRGVREEQEDYCCRKRRQCPRKDSCFPEEE